MEEIKSVRLSYDFKKNNYYKDKDGRSLTKTSDSSLNNYKLTLFKGKKEKDRRVILYRVGQNNQLTPEYKFPGVSFYYNKRYKDWLNDPDRYIEAWLSSPNNKDFSIIQDPWQESVPKRINFGYEIYFLNNGSQVFINWRTREESGFKEGGVDLIYPYSLFGKEIEKSNIDFSTLRGFAGDSFSDDDGNELDIPRWAPEKQTYIQPMSNISEEIDYGSKNFNLETGLPITETLIIGYAAKPSQIKAHLIVKHLIIWPPSDETEEVSIILLDDKNFSKIGEVNEDTNIPVGSITYPGNVKDIDILRDVIDSWKKKVPYYGELDICSEKTEFCKTLAYISPVEELQDIEKKLETTEEPKSVKEKLNVVLPKDLNLKIKQDISFKIFVGDPPKTEKPVVDGFDFGDEDDLSDLLLDDEFREEEFEGLSEAESILQEEVSKGQESFDKGTAPLLPDKIDISISRNLDDLLKDAGRIARVLGKNAKVKYENLRMGYKKDIHGLCPQGTQAVLVALTGIKELGLISGNADWFSFKNPATGGSAHSTGNGFDKSIKGKSYYNTKTRINQINGSWKGTYLQDSKLWQVGDIVAMGYTGGKLYGHIQIWTGYSWMSDFKQNAIQQKNVDPNTVALWRFNQNGINLIENKSSIV
jgi:hypothetical protein